MPDVTRSQMSSIMAGCGSATIDRYLPHINATMREYSITTRLRQAHFLAQIGHETGSLNYTVELLNYDLAQTFPGKFTPYECQAFAGNPEKIANRAYANIIGNGSESSGDGWRFRGRGLIQLTGRANYRDFQSETGVQVLSNPDRVASDPGICAKVAGWFWNRHNLNTAADRDDLYAVTRTVNGGTHGMESRAAYLRRAKQAFGIC